MSWEKEIKDWLGFSFVVPVQSGSAALELALDVLAPNARSVCVPSVSCWTIAGTIRNKGHEVVFLDQDDRLVIALPVQDIEAEVLVSVEPWGNYNNWQEVAKFSGIRILDSTLALFGKHGEKKAATFFDCAIISCGDGKPLDIGAGGILLLKNWEDYIRAKRLVFFGREELTWKTQASRFVFSRHLYEKLNNRVDKLLHSGTLSAYRHEWQKLITETGLPICIIPSAPGAGHTMLLPVFLDETFPLSNLDVYRVALAERIPLMVQPVSPAYLEEAWTGPVQHGKNVDKLARRLLFLPAEMEPTKEMAAMLKQFFETLAGQESDFRYPYAFTPNDTALPDDYRHWVTNGILAKSLGGEFILFDQLMGKLFKLTPEITDVILTHRQNAN